VPLYAVQNQDSAGNLGERGVMQTEIVRGACDHCGSKDVLVARLGFAQVAEVCQPCLATAESEVYRAELQEGDQHGQPASCPLPVLR